MAFAINRLSAAVDHGFHGTSTACQKIRPGNSNKQIRRMSPHPSGCRASSSSGISPSGSRTSTTRSPASRPPSPQTSKIFLNRLRPTNPGPRGTRFPEVHGREPGRSAAPAGLPMGQAACALGDDVRKRTGSPKADLRRRPSRITFTPIGVRLEWPRKAKKWPSTASRAGSHCVEAGRSRNTRKRGERHCARALYSCVAQESLVAE